KECVELLELAGVSEHPYADAFSVLAGPDTDDRPAIVDVLVGAALVSGLAWCRFFDRDGLFSLVDPNVDRCRTTIPVRDGERGVCGLCRRLRGGRRRGWAGLLGVDPG